MCWRGWGRLTTERARVSIGTMKHTQRILAACIPIWLASCGGGGGGGGGSAVLSPKGGQCGLDPPGQCQVSEQRSDEARFTGLKELSKRLLDQSHPLHNATLAGGEENTPIGTHVQSVAIVLSTWELEEKQNASVALRRGPEGNLHNIAQRLRCAADRLIELGPSANQSELVCWCLELWRSGRAYARMASR
jgi:hypothetical protein